MKALVIRSPWIDLILSGKKTWEMRTKKTNIRGKIALIKAGSGLIYGTAELRESLPSLSFEEMRLTQNFHAIPDSELHSAFNRRWTVPWVLRDIRPLAIPTPYSHKNGAITWVEVPDFSEAESKKRRLDTTPQDKPITASVIRKANRPTQISTQSGGPWVDVPITEGNLRNNHIYLRNAAFLLPADCIGGSNKSQAGKPIRVTFQPGVSIDCDVAGDKMILRARTPIREFFERSGAETGGIVRITLTGDRNYSINYVR